MGQYVAKHVAEERAGEFLDPDRNHAILERTGPGIWSDSVHDYLRQVCCGGRFSVRVCLWPLYVACDGATCVCQLPHDGQDSEAFFTVVCRQHSSAP
jgi:hypothetical protein